MPDQCQDVASHSVTDFPRLHPFLSALLHLWPGLGPILRRFHPCVRAFLFLCCPFPFWDQLPAAQLKLKRKLPLCEVTVTVTVSFPASQLPVVLRAPLLSCVHCQSNRTVSTSCSVLQ